MWKREEIQEMLRELRGLCIASKDTLPHLKQNEITACIEVVGGQVNNSVSQRTNSVVARDETGSRLAKARKLRVKVIDEMELLRL